MAEKRQKPHAMMIPHPLQGHVIPFVNLAMNLAAKGFTITFVNTESIHRQISKAQKHTTTVDDIFAEARKSGLDIRYTTVSDGFPLGFDRSINQDQFLEGVLHVFSAHVDELVGNILHSDPALTCMIADTFYVWTSMIARKYGLLNVSFWTEPALVFTLYYHLDLLRSHGHFGSKDNRDDIIDYIPGVPAIAPTDLMSYLQASDISTVLHRIIYKAFEDVKRADMIICNTIQELEFNTISALNQKQPFYAIGPIFPTEFTKSCVPTNMWFESDCTQWLDTKPHGSILYVSFGSLAHVSKHDIMEIAHGLLLSKVNFIWVLRPDIISSMETYTLPIGFHDDIKINDRGLIVPWCCQIEVISHPSIGGFLTHCGWNSTLESIWCTIPLLCFPLLADQLTNRKLVVDDWKIGVNLCDKKPITRNEVLKKINRLMNGKSADELREKIKEVRKTLENALATDGSSAKNFNQFIMDLNAKIQEKHGRTTWQHVNASSNQDVLI